MTETEKRSSAAQVQAMIEAALLASDVSASNARSVARALLAAEMDGQRGHGLSRVAAYAAQAQSGKVAGRAVPSVEKIAPAVLRVDAANGFAYPAIDLAIEALTALVDETAIAGASIIRSHHCGQLGAHVERMAEHGLVALMVANTPKAIAPWGGRAALFGTNPIAFAAPMADAPPLVIDLSLSKVARGKVMAAAKAGQPIPEGWALDANGNPTTDPREALEGTMAPIGDAKGTALALIVEVLASTLTGANPSYAANSFFHAEGPPPGVGQFIIAIKPDTVLGSSFAPRLAELAAQITAQEGARLPGARRFTARAEAEANGIVVSDQLRAEIESIG